MKKTMRLVLLIIIILSAFSVVSYAGENDYLIQKEYIYQNKKSTVMKKAYVEIAIGSGDFTQYQDDDYITISPNPDEIREDEYGNKYAYFDLSGIKPNEKFKIIVKRKYAEKDYTELIPSRTNTEWFEGSEIYLVPQIREDGSGDNIEKVSMIASDDPEIVSKAKELTDSYTSDYKKAQAIFEFVNVNMQYDTTEAYANKGALSAFKNMKGVCEEYATLFVSMCRAIDIPSRCVEGYLVQGTALDNSGDYVKSLGDHLWAEIYLQDFGWVPVDPTMANSGPSKGIPNLKVFCKHNSSEYEYMVNGIYNPEKANRLIAGGLTELKAEETLIPFDKVEPEKHHTFTDLEGFDWADKSIDFLYQNNVVKGYSNESYGPQNNISRIEFICMLARALRHNETEYSNAGLVYYYMDYDKYHWSKVDYDFLMRCYQNRVPSDIASAGFDVIANIFTGKLDMNKPITRAEVVALMDVFLEDSFQQTGLTDIRGNRFETSIVKAYNSGVIVGYPDGTFRPNSPITRAEMAVILERYIGNELLKIL